MFHELNLNQDQYQQLVKKVDEITIFKYIEKYGSGKLSLFYYADIRGRFTKIQYKQDYIATAIFSNLPLEDKLQVLKYLEDLDEKLF